MAFIIATGCCNDASCVDACPVDCIRPHPDDPEFRAAEQLYIDPASCIDCSACMFACPVGAIHDQLELPEHLADFADINAGYFIETPLIPRFVEAPSTDFEPAVHARIAVIGTGPAGCYAVAELSAVPGIEVTVFDRLPTPFGLVRAGVAPDHPNTKLVSDYFGTVLARPNVSCHFNVDVGTHVTIDEIQSAHHAVIYAGGATDDRKLEIPGETLRGSASARDLVSWYNGHPDHARRTFGFASDTAVVLGNGNVALDVARALARPADFYAATDMADHAVDALRNSAIREVVVIGRRGPADAACTFPELLELSRLDDVEVRVPSADLELDTNRTLTAVQQRKTDLFRLLSGDAQRVPAARRRITFRFGLEPVQLSGTGAVEALHLRPTGRPDAPLEEIRTGLVLRAIGYAVPPVAGLPYDPARQTVANIRGRVVEPSDGKAVPGLYCVGWAKRGPSGVIGTNRVCSRETTEAVIGDLRAGALPEPTASIRELERLVTSRQPDRVQLPGWQAIDAHERRNGRAESTVSPRRKIVEIARMVEVARHEIVDTTPTD